MKCLRFTVMALCVFFCLHYKAKSQNCIRTGLNQSDVTSSCYQACNNFTFQVPDLRSSTDYQVITIPYDPYPYVVAGATEDPNLYLDDQYSQAFNLPFPFCFYGQVYTQAVVGSNGVVTFDISNAGCGYAAYSISNPIPFAGGAQCVSSSAPPNYSNYYPAASIMAAFSDLDPSPAASPNDAKIQWRVEGSAPCRRFVVSYYHIGAWGNNSCGRDLFGNPVTPATFQIVMYESSGVIDVFFENKSCRPAGGNGSFAILGVQNENRDKAVAAPGKNRQDWPASKEGYRFVPTGGASRFVNAELLNLDHSPFATPTVANTTPGLLDLNFTNICTPATPTDYVLRTRFASCSDPATFLEAYDTITFTRSKMTATHSTTASSCAGASDGSATITTINGGGPYSYSLDGGPVVPAGTSSPFTIPNLSPGTHSVIAYGALSCETDPITVNITDGPPLTTTASVSNVLCNAGTTGSITVTQPTAGAPPYTYSLDGINWQSGNIFNGLTAGDYIVYYRSGNGCSGQLNRTITEPPVLNATASSSAVICNGESNGTITVAAPTGGTAPYEYSIDGVNWQAGNTFNVAANTYNVIVRDANGCTVANSVTVTEPAALSATAATTNATCNGGNDGTITVTAGGGNSNYQYATDAASFQNSNVFNVAPGTYTITVKDNLGCTYTLPGVVVGLTNDLTYTAPAMPTICEGSSTQLDITSNATEYSWLPATGLSNAGIYNPVANPTTTTNYTVTLTYGRCTADVPVTVNVNAAPLPDAGAQGFICYGQSYTLQASGGVDYRWSPSTYLDNSNIANPVATPDRTTTYTLSILRDANGCPSLITDDVIVDVTPPIKVTTFPFDTIAYAGDQFRILATSAATDYLWTPSIGLSADNIADPVVTAGAVGDVLVYKVTASTSAGCKGEGYVRVQVYKGPDIYVASGFTPNNDGLNDKFFPLPVGIREIKYFRVFNRAGQLMFETRKLNDGWDGKVAGKDQPNGVYVWMAEGITRDGKVITKKGTVTLIR